MPDVPSYLADYADLYALLVDAARIDGQLYATRVSAHVLALLYNRALFDEAGLFAQGCRRLLAALARWNLWSLRYNLCLLSLSWRTLSLL